MSLEEIEYGSLASSQTVNNNFNYLYDEIQALATTVAANKSSLTATMESNFANLSSSIEELQENLEENQVGLSLENISSTGILNCINWIMPNYSSGSSFSCPYTTTKPGWVYLGGKQDVTSSIYIGGVYFEISYDTGDGQSRGNLFMPVAKGVVIKSPSNVRTQMFYPCSGV